MYNASIESFGSKVSRFFISIIFYAKVSSTIIGDT